MGFLVPEELHVEGQLLRIDKFFCSQEFHDRLEFCLLLLESIFMDLLLFMLILNKDLITSFLLDHVIKRQQQLMPLTQSSCNQDHVLAPT